MVGGITTTSSGTVNIDASNGGTNTNGSVILCHSTTLTGSSTLDVTSGSLGSVTELAGVNVSAPTINITTPTLTQDANTGGGTSTITSTVAPLTIASNGPNQALQINQGTGSTLSATAANANVNFNTNTAGGMGSVTFGTVANGYGSVTLQLETVPQLALASST